MRARSARYIPPMRSRGPSGPPQSGKSGETEAPHMRARSGRYIPPMRSRGPSGPPQSGKSGETEARQKPSRGPSGPLRRGKSGKLWPHLCGETTGRLLATRSRGSVNKGAIRSCRRGFCGAVARAARREAARAGKNTPPLSRRPVTYSPRALQSAWHPVAELEALSGGQCMLH